MMSFCTAGIAAPILDKYGHRSAILAGAWSKYLNMAASHCPTPHPLPTCPFMCTRTSDRYSAESCNVMVAMVAIRWDGELSTKEGMMSPM